MRQKWYQRASVQSALVNSIPNVGILLISIVTVIITYNISENQRSYNQANFDKQFSRDSVLSIQQDSITKQQTYLANLQLNILNRQFKNDSIDNLQQLLISQQLFNLNEKKKIQSDLMNNENLAIKGVSFITYETKHQGTFLDSLYGFKPDLVYKTSTDQTVSKDFELLYRLTLYDPKSDSEISNLPVLQTLSEMSNYMYKNHISSKFQILKKFTFIFNFQNKTEFPITLLGDSLVYIVLPFSHGLYSSYKSALPSNKKSNNLIIYPGEKSGIPLSFMSTLDWKLDKDFTSELNLDYITIFGRKTKKIKALFDSRDKTFLLYD